MRYSGGEFEGKRTSLRFLGVSEFIAKGDRMSETRIIPTTGRNNCGGRCLLFAHFQDGKILKMTTETAKNCSGHVPRTACARGLNYHKTFLGKDRLREPMIRTGERGEGRFKPISWTEAVERISQEWIRIRDNYGPGSRYVNYATGVSAAFSPESLAKRLLSLDGGFLDSYNSYSSACICRATELMYGTLMTGNSLSTWQQSKMILLVGHNPAETRFDSETMFYLKKAKEAGVPIVVIDPRKSDTVKVLDARWIPIRPATDSALFDALCYVIWREGMADQAFLDRYCVGFDEEHMPAGSKAGGSVLSYLSGRADGVCKDEKWAESITGIPEETIHDLAVAFAKAKPATLIQGYGAQRHAYGEQSARGGILLACMTGNIGVPGGSAVGGGHIARYVMPHMPYADNPYPYSIPVFRWTDAIDHGTEMGPRQGVRGKGNLKSNIKMILNLAGNTLINQHSDINRTIRLLKDTRKCEFIVCSDLFMTASAKFADILLPGVSMFEEDNLTGPWHYDGFIGSCSRMIEPLYDSRFEYDWLSEVSENLGLKEYFTMGRSTREWLDFMLDECRRFEASVPDLETLQKNGIWYFPETKPYIAFEENIKDPENNPFPTKSGKIELYSTAVDESEFEDFFPAIPRYVEPQEGFQDPLREKFPLQLIGWHTKRRCHTIHDNNPDLERLDPQRLVLHPNDAKRRFIKTGDLVLVYNDRGRVKIPALVSEDIMEGVAALAQGAWYTPDKDGTDTNGSINVLTSWHPTPYARGNPQHTNLVEVIRFSDPNDGTMPSEVRDGFASR